MMMVLLDEPTLLLFESPDRPPGCLEAVDVMNGEYSFCDDQGQRYVGFMIREAGWFRAEEVGLRPEGAADVANALKLVERAEAIMPNEWFHDIEPLRRYLKARG